ncbi:hypothetical protein A1351_04095 [Methylosinus sp. R-45379]|uniref:hypothetical protein n=1 Tax=unclassified Methylosinus TaxID=2624500 RepID=UPI000465A01F|nr:MULTISPECIES: hypothetical protein [unclassified Methylosinus]OAI22679.1 hypothetical protein A1351_04095 [Methylosinus sp. R-45379]TDX66633.1 hypothetical protein EDE12_101166 [Methylosinus sp. sav-2]
MIARALACLLMLQGFIAAAGPTLAEQTRDVAGWTEAHATTSELCNRQSGERPSGDHSSCEHCVLCMLGARSAASIVAAIWNAATIVLAADLHSHAPPRSTDAAKLSTPLGWASSWSSRAPPSFS